MRTKDDKNCPYCLSHIEAGQEKVRCPKCGVMHHRDCWEANGSCSVYGCDGWAVWSHEISEKLAPSVESIEISAESVSKQKAKKEFYCLKCGAPVREDEVTCLRCRTKGLARVTENCLGPSVIALATLVGVILSLVIRLV